MVVPVSSRADRDRLPPRAATALAVRDLQTEALALVAGTAAVTALVVGTRRRSHHARTVAALSVVTGLLALAVLPLRRLVLWDQLGLWAVTTGTDAGRGAWWAARNDAVRFVIVGNAEVTQERYLVSAVAHTVVVPLLMVVAAAWAVWLSWRRP